MATTTRKIGRKAIGAFAAGVLAVGALAVGYHRARTGVSPEAATRELLATADDAAATGAAGNAGGAADARDAAGTAAGNAAPAGWDIPNLDHSRVDYWIGRFQTDKRSDFETYL